MVTFPPAKINLGLRIIDKRPDGYHNLETVFYPVGLTDALEFTILNDGFSDRLVVTGTTEKIAHDDNLVIKALKKVREKHDVPPLDIHLHKAIPSGAGLGGGSSDASSFITVLNNYFSLGISEPVLFDMAASLGSDCAFFINKTPAFATGRGEKLLPLPPVRNEWFISIVKPSLYISTAMAYGSCKPSGNGPDMRDIYSEGPDGWKEKLINDFESTLFIAYPELKEIKTLIYKSGAVYASLSGSGSAFFGIFRQKPELCQQLKPLEIWSGSL
jgi:4-diphosphocytidyl-2-C-methyl-D-erythritol kinase